MADPLRRRFRLHRLPSPSRITSLARVLAMTHPFPAAEPARAIKAAPMRVYWTAFEARIGGVG